MGIGLSDIVDPLGGVDPATIFTRILYIVYPMLAILFVGLIIYGGYNYMTANGEDGKIRKAQGTITSAIIGMSITVAAFAITSIIGRILNVDVLKL